MSAATEGVWDRAARGYARQEPLERATIARTLDLAAPQPGERLLDAATGTGLLLRALARRPGRPASAVGVDASRAMLDRVGPLPAPWRVLQGDAAALPFTDASFDVATAAYLLHVLDAGERAAALAELRRVLAPGGRLVVATVWAGRRPGRALLEAPARAAPATFGGLRPLDPRPELAAGGWRIERAAALHRGYPSLVVRARRD